MPYLNYSLRTACASLLIAVGLFAAEDRKVDPTWLYRHVPNVQAQPSDVSTSTCHYRSVFGAGDPDSSIVRGVARFGEISVDPGGSCTDVTYPREEQMYVILEGSGSVQYGDSKHPVKKEDFLYLPPTVKHGVSNPSSAPLRLLVYGYKVPASMTIKVPAQLMIANINDVPLQVVGGHPPSTKYRLLMGTTESKRDRIAAAHVMTSLFIMEFEPSGTNHPHHHDTEEEIYYLMDGTGDMVAGGGKDGVMGKHQAKPGDAYFYRLNATVGFFNPPPPASKARILAARSIYPSRERGR